VDAFGQIVRGGGAGGGRHIDSGCCCVCGDNRTRVRTANIEVGHMGRVFECGHSAEPILEPLLCDIIFAAGRSGANFLFVALVGKLSFSRNGNHCVVHDRTGLLRKSVRVELSILILRWTIDSNEQKMSFWLGGQIYLEYLKIP